MTFEQVIDKYKPLTEVEDYVQDCWLMKLEHPELDDETVCKKCRTKIIHQKIVTRHTIAKSLYNDDGECIDDNLYFVDERTIEHNEGGYVDDDTKDHVAMLAKIMDKVFFILSLNKSVGITIDYSRFRDAQIMPSHIDTKFRAPRIKNTCLPHVAKLIKEEFRKCKI